MAGADDAPSLNGSGPAEAKHTEVKDEDGYLRQRRLNAIHQARERVHEAINKVEELRIVGRLQQRKANSYVRRAVENYIREIRYPLKSTEEGSEYWEDKPIGTFQVQPPTPAELAWKHKDRHDIGFTGQGHTRSELPPEYSLATEHNPEPTTVQLVGLKSLFDAPNPIAEVYELEYHVRFEGRVTVREPVERQLPRDILLRYFDLAIEASGEIGLEASMDDDDGAGGFDLDDLEDVDWDLSDSDGGGGPS